MLKQTEKEGIVKDTSTGALINTNKASLSAYKRQKKKFQQIDVLQQENIQIRAELEEIKKTLRELLKKVE